MLARLLLLAVAIIGCPGGRSKDEGAATPAAPPVAVASAPPEDPHPAQNRVVIIGLPGVDPDWVDRWRRDLPELDRLMSGQRQSHLETTLPPNSAAAWTTFATGTLPGKHGVYGLIGRDPATYRPLHGVMQTEAPVYAEDGSLITPPGEKLTRVGTPFWRLAAAAGDRVKLLWVPWVWAPDEPAGVKVLAGEGLPDLRLTNSTFTLFGSDVDDATAAADVPGGDLVRLSGTGPYTALIPGPDDARGGRSTLPLNLTIDGVDRVVLEAGGQHVEGRVGAYTDWVTLHFALSDKVQAAARVRFFPVAVGDVVRLYMTPLTVDPREPWLPAASPPEYGRQVFDTYGDWKALGWAFDTSGLSSDQVPEAVLATEIRDVFDRRLQILLGELGRRDADLFVGVLGGADAVSHMFMRLSDPSHPAYDERLAGTYGGLLKEIYVDIDRGIGEIRSRLRSGDTLIVLSEAGFQTFRREFQVNTWLAEHGYLKLAAGVSKGEDTALTKDTVDWKHTTAYAVGSGFVYLNLKGREAQGNVLPARARPLLQEMAGRLLELHDGRVPVLSRVLLGEDLYRGASAASAPDLVLAMSEGYQVGRASSLGRVPVELLNDNRRRWSGDHAASDPNEVQGLLVTNLDTPPKAPRLVDVSPTALALLGIPAPVGAEGRSWVEVRSRPAPVTSDTTKPTTP